MCARPCFCLFFPILLYKFFVTAHKPYSKVNLNLEAQFSINICTSLQINPRSGNEREQQNLFWCCTDLPVSVCCSLCLFLFCFSLVQIQDFSSGFWDGSKLACWMKGETPWMFFPKLSIYLRATNTSQSFRITILPQVSG